MKLISCNKSEPIKIANACGDFVFEDGKGVVKSVDGLWLPSYTWQQEDAIYRNGVRLKSLKRNERIITVKYKRCGCSRCEYWDIRKALGQVITGNNCCSDQNYLVYDNNCTWSLPVQNTGWKARQNPPPGCTGLDDEILCFDDLFDSTVNGYYAPLNDFFKYDADGNKKSVFTIEHCGKQYCIDVYLYSAEIIEHEEEVWDEWCFEVEIKFIAPDPVWRSCEPNVWQGLPYDLQDTDCCLPICFGYTAPFNVCFSETWDDGCNANRRGIEYNGSLPTYPLIMIRGPIWRPTIINLTTNQTLTVDYIVKADEVVYINLMPGYKTVTAVDYGNFGQITDLMSALPLDTCFSKFYLQPNCEINEICISGSNSNDDTKIQFVWFDQYEAI